MKKFIRSILIVFMITAMAIPISRFGGWSALISANAVDNAALTGAESFTDVPKDAWYYSAVDFVVKKNIFTGTSEDTFEPLTNMTRAMFVRMLANYTGADLTQYTAPSFEDVSINTWYGPAVAWAAENKLVMGVSETEFSPNSEITREQMCTLIIRYANYAKIDFKEEIDFVPFSDDPLIGSYAKDSVYACQKYKLAAGIGNGEFNPLGTVTRAQAATIMMNVAENRIIINDYKNIPCREVKEYKYIYPALETSNTALLLKIPKDWAFEKADSIGYYIFRGDQKIGTFTSDIPVYEEIAETVAYSESVPILDSAKDDLLLKESILKYTANGEVSFTYQLIFEFRDGSGTNFVLEADYAEISSTTLTRIKNAMRLEMIKTPSGVGTLSLKEGRDSILILGNSFVNTSKIGYILQDMCNIGGESCYVEAISRGYASVTTYAKDTAKLSQIRNGEYGIVFMCGLYSSEDLSNLEVIKSACDASGTPLVVFPAHNESDWSIQSVSDEYTGITLLNWKNEIDFLIKSGVSYDDFCIDDQHQHSTELAGYVGAHMIYRTVFGEIPPDLGGESILTQFYVDKKLKQYPQTGEIQRIKESLIYYLK